jgi:two-component system, NarL family, sensor kinase
LSDAGQRPALDERLVAEQDERRRLAELIHDGPVQHLAAVAQMLDAALGGLSPDGGRGTRSIVQRALELTREASSDLRELVTGLEPDALRKQGFTAAVHLLVERVAGRRGIAAEIDIAADVTLGEASRVGLYQIVRESLDQAIRRGPPTRISIRARLARNGAVELVITDNGSRERRQAVLDGLSERAESLNAAFHAERRPGEGTTIRVVVPPSTAER